MAKTGFFEKIQKTRKIQVLGNERLTKTRPAGFEPATYGLEIRAVGIVSICE